MNPVTKFLLALVIFCVPFGGCVSSETNQSSGKIEVARQLVDSKDYVKAIKMLRELRLDHPGEVTVEMLMGNACLGLGDHAAALDAFRRAVDADKNNDDARLNYGYVLILHQRFAEARKMFDEILEENTYPYVERVHVNYGLSLMEEGSCDKAVDHFKQALRSNPTMVSAYFNLGKCQMRGQDYGQAIESLMKAVNFCPGCVDPVMELAKSYYLSGKKREGVAQLETFLSKDRDPDGRKRVRELLRKMKPQ